MDKKKLRKYAEETAKRSYDLKKIANLIDSKEDFDKVTELRELQDKEYHKGEFLKGLLNAMDKMDQEERNMNNAQ